MHGYEIAPLAEYILCRELWGAPNEILNFDGTKSGQGNFQSVMGITKIIRHFGVPAECFGIPELKSVGEHIESVLKEGRQVIFCTRPRADNTDNPFSTGYHWVMAVGYTEGGKMLVANSSENIRAAECRRSISTPFCARSASAHTPPISRGAGGVRILRRGRATSWSADRNFTAQFLISTFNLLIFTRACGKIAV